MIKNFAKSASCIPKTAAGKNTRELYMHVMGAMAEAPTLDQLNDILDSATIVFCSRNKTALVNGAYRHLGPYLSRDIQKEDAVENCNVPEDFPTGPLLR